MFPEFIYDSYEYDVQPDGMHISFCFRMMAAARKGIADSGLVFRPTAFIPSRPFLHPDRLAKETLDSLVKAGKVRALGASAMYGYQFHNLQQVAKDNGWTQFTSMQNHYNLLYREDERELIPVCQQFDVALAPYSPLASGHLTRATWDSDSVRSTTDGTYKAKYDHAKENDLQIIARVDEIAQKRGVPMAHVALAWLWARGCASVLVGCSKPARVDDAVAALATKLTADELSYLEEPYAPHTIVGAL